MVRERGLASPTEGVIQLYATQCDKPIVLESYRQGDSVQRVHGALTGLFLGGHIFLWFPVSSYFLQQAL